MGSIPVVDLAAFPGEGGKLLAACEEVGCFRVVNHGIPESLLAEMKAAVVSLFDRPAEVKRRNKGAMFGTGYISYPGGEPMFEQLGIYNGASPADVDAFCSQLDASPQQREVIRSYASKLNGLAVHIARKIADSMGLAGASAFEEWTCTLRPNKYSFTEENVGDVALQEHTDISFLTVLQVDPSTASLEMMDKSSGTYLPVAPLPGSLLVNLGDVATAWSNGRLHNVRHRVMCRQAAQRFTVTLFLLAPKDGRVAAPDSLAAAGRPRLYRPFDYEEYLKFVYTSKLCAGQSLPLYAADHGPDSGSALA